jgi:hypothetical protein
MDGMAQNTSNPVHPVILSNKGFGWFTELPAVRERMSLQCDSRE